MRKAESFANHPPKDEITRRAIRAIGDPDYLEEVLAIVAQKLKHSWRAAWIVAKMAEMEFVPDLALADRYLTLSEEGDQAVQRCMLRGLMARKNYPEDMEGRIYDLSLRILDTPGVTVATLGPAFDLAFRVCVHYPELWPELEQRLSRFSETDSNAMQAILRRIWDGYREKIASRL